MGRILSSGFLRISIVAFLLFISPVEDSNHTRPNMTHNRICENTTSNATHDPISRLIPLQWSWPCHKQIDR